MKAQRGAAVALVVLGLVTMAPVSTEAAVRSVFAEYFTNIY